MRTYGRRMSAAQVCAQQPAHRLLPCLVLYERFACVHGFDVSLQVLGAPWIAESLYIILLLGMLALFFLMMPGIGFGGIPECPLPDETVNSMADENGSVGDEDTLHLVPLGQTLLAHHNQGQETAEELDAANSVRAEERWAWPEHVEESQREYPKRANSRDYLGLSGKPLEQER